MSIEAIRQALTAFEWNYNTDLDNIPACEQWAKMLKTNITALRAAIEQAQEPVAWMCADDQMVHRGYSRFSRTCAGDWNIPVYTVPRQWQGLTEIEFRMLYVSTPDYKSLWQAIEAKLKEKNCG